ncbi:hypothetical protein [Deinococcus fonticola]|uniref:hypothetical protein n=1 Tax=Deinococcus fonticola TaxID=2528713 RepID=UPI00143044F5|nr:hypothetical protein [Deinococcus fonticola]
MNTETSKPTHRDELDGVELLFLADMLSRQPDQHDYAELEQKLRRLSEQYIEGK